MRRAHVRGSTWTPGPPGMAKSRAPVKDLAPGVSRPGSGFCEPLQGSSQQRQGGFRHARTGERLERRVELALPDLEVVPRVKVADERPEQISLTVVLDDSERRRR